MVDYSTLDAAALDALYNRLIADSGKCEVPPNAEIPALVFDSQESEDRFLALIAREQANPSPERQPGASRWHFVAGGWVQTEG